jgi:glutaredoxin
LEIPVNNLIRESKTAKRQECTVQSLYFSGAVGVIGYAAGLVFLTYRADWPALLLWLILLPCLKWAYLRFFPHLSKLKGYGSLDDDVPANVKPANVEVTYYSLLGCPFCPIVEHRLKTLQKDMDFTLTKVDLTLRPQMSTSRGIRSVPVVEVGEHRLIGNVTTEQLARLISHEYPSAPSRAG